MKNPLVMGSYGDPQSLNRYNYTRNDPINSMDPSGLDSWCFGYGVFLITTKDDQIIDVTYLGFIPVYCWDDGNGMGGGNGTGDSGGGPIPGQGTELSRHNQREFRQRVLGSDCKKALDQKGLTDAIINAVEGVQFFDVDDPSIGGEQASLFFPDYTGNLTVDEYFRRFVDPPDPAISAAHTIGLGYPFAGIYARGGVGAFINANGVQTGFLMHELAHYTTGKNDFGLWEMFGMPPPPEGMTYSDVVTAFFNNDCPEGMITR
jgi:hypothetical protein